MGTDIKNECLINGVQYKCRTCFDPGRTVYSLTDEASNAKTWGDLLKDIAQIKKNEDELLPKTVCCKCQEKLKRSYDFILQIHNVNKKYSQLLANGKDPLQSEHLNENYTFNDCLAESAINLPLEQYMPEIKLEQEMVSSYNIDLDQHKLDEDNETKVENEDTDDPFTEPFDEEFKSASENERMIYEYITADENWNVSYLEDKSLLQKLPLDYASNLPQTKDNNRILPSSSKKRQTNPEMWKSNIRKRLRESGQAYVSINNKEFPARTLKPPCKNCFLKCDSLFSYNDRMQIHQSFWNMSDDEKSNFYFKFVARNPVKRRRSSSTLKKFSFFYYFEKDTVTYRVCRTFFLNTLCIDQKRIYYCFEHLNDANTGLPLPRKKGKNVKRKKVTSSDKPSEVSGGFSKKKKKRQS